MHTIATNIKSTEVVLELAAKHVRPVLVASTSEVYGKLDAPKFSEDQVLLSGRPASPAGAMRPPRSSTSTSRSRTPASSASP